MQRQKIREILIGTNKGVIKARSVRRKANVQERWNLGQFNNIKGTPWELVPGSNSTEIKSKVNLDKRTNEQITKEREEGEEEQH